MIRALHLFLTVHPLDNYPTRLMWVHEETRQDLFSCCGPDGICIDMANGFGKAGIHKCFEMNKDRRDKVSALIILRFLLLLTGKKNILWLELIIFQRTFSKGNIVDLVRQPACAPHFKMTTQKHPLYVFYVPFRAFPQTIAVKAHLTFIPPLAQQNSSFSFNVISCLCFKRLGLLRLVSSGSVSLWCRGIKGNVALCQRLDLFSPPSRNAKGQRETRSSRSDVWSYQAWLK